ncbi:CBO0543 family protein [Bacillus sinesaloumensis]|uniref:CBO0543 family protein n=1 Tax=Litchfieldia sinesaloumensis TaxID=1926280 RepID=UPI0009883CB5|nr:CBO0543 family protein [Bacillus sinesaloumensis]
MNAIYGFVWLLALFVWGDWRNPKKYYSTYLFFLLGDFLYLYFFSDYYPMWSYAPQGFDEDIGLTNTHVVLSIMAIKYPATILIFLGRYPGDQSWVKQLIYILMWSSIYGINEALDLFFGLITYDNGWSIWWSVLFNFVMFSILRLHFVRPLRAWVASSIFILILWHVFDVPSSVFR